ncbi:MAG: hypothetical protein IJP76_04545 [Paludibacteraceae bacterium]|nr:hypothetical protein [Paludibacteraceae bacterium]
MTDGAHVAIHASENMIIVRAGVRGVNEDLHGRNRVVMVTKQTTVVVAGVGVGCRMVIDNW